ncbi:Na+/Picotransporter [Halothece sp. PCC 7418]|uniref:Na/Pi symporter n=1 Tax=Halothece sp. (strain PCC 7418) TaxID=65093 RepID=UPI0002A08607|nr:Na/Pi symporter [Halothece sp. PCC 7418]AFZ44604.1 Na+/Picotransporter [Halothece sp. PCC 7418]
MNHFFLNSLKEWRNHSVLNWIAVSGLLYFLLVGVRLISTGFEFAFGSEAEGLFAFASNPFLGLMIGILATALIQSSSTVSAIAVSLVAGGLPVSTAVPIIMGANVGTTITNTIVSLGHLNASEEFKRAFAAATIHDCFNFCCLVLFFPLEIMFHGLENSAKYLGNLLINFGSSWNLFDFNILDWFINPLLNQVLRFTQSLPPKLDGIALAVFGLVLIFGSIFYLSKLLKYLLIGKARLILNSAIGTHPVISILAGTGITCLIQSSSATTSLMIPLAGNGVFTLEQIYPFTLGANIGTCLTALLAATAFTGNAALPGLEIALVHFLYNSLGVLIIYSTPMIRDIPIKGARFLADMATRYKLAALGYLVTFFLVLPALFLGFFFVLQKTPERMGLG